MSPFHSSPISKGHCCLHLASQALFFYAVPACIRYCARCWRHRDTGMGKGSALEELLFQQETDMTGE